MAIIIIGKKGLDLDGLEQRIKALGMVYERKRGLARFFIVEGYSVEHFPLSDDSDIKAIVDSDKHFPMADANTQILIQRDQFNPDYGWQLPRIIRRNAPWPIEKNQRETETLFYHRRTGKKVDVYIADSGIDCRHPDFNGRAKDLDGNSEANNSLHWHATSVASCVGVSGCGTATNCNLWSVAATSGTGISFDNANLVNAFDQIAQHYESRASLNQPAIVNGSLGGYGAASTAVVEAVADLIDVGIVCCFAAGNENYDLDNDEDINPGEVDPDVVCVAGSAINDFDYNLGGNGTCYGVEAVDIVSPGQYIRAAYWGAGGFGYHITLGTSFATPFVTGVAACMLEGYGRLTSRTEVQALKQRLLDNATTGKITPTTGKVLPDRLLYLDPGIAFESIPGLSAL